MAKTDKELTTEIVCEFIRAWGTQSNCRPIDTESLPHIIRTVYDTIDGLYKDDK